MKKLLAILLAAVMVLSLTACKDKDGDKGGGALPTPEQAIEKIQEMPTSTNESAIEGAVGEVFGVDISLPEGTYSAQPFSYGGVSAYVVTVSGTSVTAQEYYNSIKAEMLAKGYMAEDGELAFYKFVGTVVYSVSVEADGNDICVSMGVASLTSNPINPNNPSNPSNPSSGQFLTAAELAEFDATGLTVPTGLTAVSKDVNLNSFLFDKEATVMLNGGTTDNFTALATALFAIGFNADDEGVAHVSVASAIHTYEGVDYIDFSSYKISEDRKVGAIMSMSNGFITLSFRYEVIEVEVIRTTWLTAEEKQTWKLSLDMPTFGTLTEVDTWDLSGFGVQQKRIDFYFTDVTLAEFEAYAQQVYTALNITVDEFGDAVSDYDDCRGSNNNGAKQTFEGCYSYDENSSGLYYLITVTHYAEAMDALLGNQIGYDAAANSVIISFLIDEI